MQIFYTKNKQTGQLILFVFGHFDQKPKNQKWNQPDINDQYLQIIAEAGSLQAVIRQSQNTRQAVIK